MGSELIYSREEKLNDTRAVFSFPQPWLFDLFFSPPVKALHYSILHIYISNIRTLLSSLIFLFLPSCPRGPGFRIIPQDPTQTTVSWLISSVSQNMETWGHTEFALHYYYTWISHTDWFRSFEMFQKMFQTWNIK